MDKLTNKPINFSELKIWYLPPDFVLFFIVNIFCFLLLRYFVCVDIFYVPVNKFSVMSEYSPVFLG